GVLPESPLQHSHDSLRVQPEKKHICDICSKAFPYLSILESHKRCHTGEKPFKCHYCDKKFAQKATLQVHERTHTGERPYKCRYCEKTFAQYGTKTVHEKSAHLGIRNYKCPKCDKCLSSPSALYTHKKTHGDKVFRCQFCTKTFTLKNYLKLHVHEQTERKHVCKFCHKSFAYAGSLQKSQLTAHEATHGMCGGVAPAPAPMAPFDLNQSVAAALGATTLHDHFTPSVIAPTPPQKLLHCSGCAKPYASRSGLKAHQDSCAAFLNSSGASSASSASNPRHSASPANDATSSSNSDSDDVAGGEENVMLVEGRKLALEPLARPMAVPDIYAAVGRPAQQPQLQPLQQQQQRLLQPFPQQQQQPLAGGLPPTPPSWLQRPELSPLGAAKAPMGATPALPDLAALTSSVGSSAFAPVVVNNTSTDLLRGILDQQQQLLTSLLLQQLTKGLEGSGGAAAAAAPPPQPLQQPQPNVSLELLQLLQSAVSGSAAAPIPTSSLPPLNISP
ncbi:hypothetical protein PFISCL1PPCAC_13755, partial [Pristionchus fissidentatus]